jgi:hypothetical protein
MNWEGIFMKLWMTVAAMSFLTANAFSAPKESSDTSLSYRGKLKVEISELTSEIEDIKLKSGSQIQLDRAERDLKLAQTEIQIMDLRDEVERLQTILVEDAKFLSRACHPVTGESGEEVVRRELAKVSADLKNALEVRANLTSEIQKDRKQTAANVRELDEWMDQIREAKMRQRRHESISVAAKTSSPKVEGMSASGAVPAQRFHGGRSFIVPIE